MPRLVACPACRGSRRRWAAFMAVHKDPDYLADAAKMRVELSPVSGEVVMQAIEKIANAPPDLLDYLRKLHADDAKGG